jgi:dUTPase
MREIKFRAWDGEKIIHHIPNSAVSTGSYLEMMGTTLKLMQYTGLKDKNGVEIYEGDIILDKDYSGEFSYMKKPKAYVAEFERIIHKFFEGLFDEQCEVIGNIYQNPELLSEPTPAGE